jgi:ABC-type multidrug transport system fused ATPase/permease subunit
VQLAKRLYKHYLNQNILFYNQNNNSTLLKRINNDTEIVNDALFIPLIQLNAKIILLISIFFFIFFINPLIIIFGFFLFFFIYYFIYKIIRYKIKKNAENSSRANEERLKISNESFSGIRELIMNNSFDIFLNIFNLKSKKIGNYRIKNLFLTSSIRYFVEFIGFSVIIFLVIYFISVEKNSLTNVLPFLAIYVIALIKVLPLFQQIYNLLSHIRIGMVSFYNIRKDFNLNFISNLSSKKFDPFFAYNKNFLTKLETGITLRNINFSYPNKGNLLKDINIFIPAKKITGIVGITGSGKSTTVHYLCGSTM